MGAALDRLSCEGRELVLSVPAPVPLPRFRGAVLVPWPNRIGDGAYDFDGDHHQLAITEPERGTALHGLALWHAWEPVRVRTDTATLRTTIHPQPGYPFTLAVEVTYRLDDDGLLVTVETTNAGTRAAPYGTSIHPYLTTGGAGGVDEWTLQVPAGTVVQIDPDRLLPTGVAPVDGTAFDFRTARVIGSTTLDHALGDVTFDDSGRAGATLTGPDGAGVRMTWGTACPWVQVHTTDTGDARTHRRGLAFEPMTCPPDAFRSGTGLVELVPGQRHVAWWRIAAC